MSITTAVKKGKHTVEYQKLLKTSDSLVPQLAAAKCAGTLANKLRAKELIPDSVYNAATSYGPGITEPSQIRAIIDAMLPKVERNSENYYIFLRILNEELGRHRGKNDDRQCKLCRGECESVVHVLWECPAYDSIRNNFMVELENLLGGRFGEFSTLDHFNKASFILGFENWNRDDFKALLKLVKSFVLLIWETRKKELYGDQDCVVSGCSCSCPLTGGLTSSACVCGCVVNGVSATAAT